MTRQHLAETMTTGSPPLYAAAIQGPVLVAVVDRQHARFFVVGPWDARELTGIRPVATRGGKFHGDRRGSPGSGENKYHNRRVVERERRYEAVARELQKLQRRHDVNGFVIGGPSAEQARLSRFITERFPGRVLGAIHLVPRTVTPATIYRAIEALRIPVSA
jgi:hypothetical protein